MAGTGWGVAGLSVGAECRGGRRWRGHLRRRPRKNARQLVAEIPGEDRVRLLAMGRDDPGQASGVTELVGEVVELRDVGGFVRHLGTRWQLPCALRARLDAA